MGWEELDVINTDIRDPSQGRDDTNRLVLRVFGSEDGTKLFDWLMSLYVNVPVAVPGTDASYAFFAEGQRTVVRDLMHRMKLAKEM